MIRSKRGWQAAALAAVGAMVLGLTAVGANAQSARSVQPHKTYKVGVVLTYSNTDFWSAYDAYQSQFAKQLGVQLVTATPTNGNVGAQNSAIESLVTADGVKAIIVNPESANSLGGQVASFLNKHKVNVISVDTTLSSGHAYVVVRASNLIYGEDACALIASKVHSGDVLDLEGDLASSNGADRTNGFNACMAANAPHVKVVGEPTVWNDSTAVSDAQTARNQYGSNLKAIYSQWSSPETGIAGIYGHGTGFLPNYNTGAHHIDIVGDDGVPFEMCDIQHGSTDAAQSQPANLYAYWSLKFAIDALRGVHLKVGEKFGGLGLVSQTYGHDRNLGYPVAAPFITKTTTSYKVKPYSVDGVHFGGSVKSTPVTNHKTWGWSYTLSSHGTGDPCTTS
jgi:simple sugar transport system substrate-binding protein/ribose transport system substrate-binding protein